MNRNIFTIHNYVDVHDLMRAHRNKLFSSMKTSFSSFEKPINNLFLLQNFIYSNHSTSRSKKNKFFARPCVFALIRFKKFILTLQDKKPLETRAFILILWEANRERIFQTLRGIFDAGSPFFVHRQRRANRARFQRADFYKLTAAEKKTYNSANGKD